MVEIPVLMYTKLNRPATPADFVSRTGLVGYLTQALSKPLILFSAPAGYGKTTLASDWAQRVDCPNAWVSLDENDDQLGGFLAYFLAAIQSMFPDAVLKTRVLLAAPDLPPLHAVASSLSNDLYQLTQNFVLVLDDYSVIHDPAVHQLVSELLKHPPRSMHLVLTCRHDPPLPVHSLRARHQMVEIRRQGLRFSRAEIETFMQKVIGVSLSARAITILEEKTEGWATGLRLAALSLLHSEDPEQQFSRLEGDNRYVLEYLASEVISGLPKEIQEFLLTTSILEWLCGSLCDRIVGLDEMAGKSQAYLEWLEKANLFIVPLDSQGTWRRYHHLFQDILKQLLIKSRSPQEVALLHARASAWFSENNFVEEAISHALAAGDEGFAIQLVEKYRYEAMNREAWQQLERWLRLIPRRIIDERPELLMLEAWIMDRTGRIADSAACLDRVEALLEKQNLPDPEHRRLKGELSALRSHQLCWQGEVERALGLARAALDAAGFELSYVRGTAWMALAAALHIKGELNAAFETLYAGLREDRYHQNTYPTRLLIALASIYWTEANPTNLIQTAEYLLKLSFERDLPESLNWAHYFLGYACYQKNELEAAEKHFSFVAGQQPAAHSIAYTESIFGLAATYLAQGLAERARERVEAALPVALERNDPGLVSSIQAFLAHLALAQENSVDAQYWALQGDSQFRITFGPAIYDPTTTLAQVYIDMETPDSLKKAYQLLARRRASAEATHSTSNLITALALQAMLLDASGKPNEALLLLNQSSFLAQPGGMLRLFIDLGPRLAGLARRLQRQGAASGYLKRIIQAFPSQNPTPAPAPVGAQSMIEPLTDRELEILALLAQRMSNKEIAQELVISPMTVKRHTINIYQKLNTNSRREAVDVASALGLFNLRSLTV
jgi:LuxR family maltose regulon positive regulatory protein